MDERLHFQANGTLKGHTVLCELCTIEIKESCFSVVLRKNENYQLSLDVEYSSLASVTRNDFTTISFVTQNDFLSLTGRCQLIDVLLTKLQKQGVFHSIFVITACDFCGTVDVCSVAQTMSEKCRFCQRIRTPIDDTQAISMLKKEIEGCSQEFQNVQHMIGRQGKDYVTAKHQKSEKKRILQRECQFWLQRIQQQKASLSMVTNMMLDLEEEDQESEVVKKSSPKLKELQIAEQPTQSQSLHTHTKTHHHITPLTPEKVSRMDEIKAEQSQQRATVRHVSHVAPFQQEDKLKEKTPAKEAASKSPQEEQPEKKKTSPWKMILLLLFATIAFVGVVVGVVFITSTPQKGGGNPLDRLITGGTVTTVGGLLILALEEYLIKKRGKTYGPFFDLAVGLAFFMIQGGVFALIARGISEWSILAECIAVVVLAILCRLYLKNHIGGLPDVDKRFRYGGVFSWTAAVFSTLIISWIAFPIWPLFHNASSNWRMAGEVIVIVCAFCLSLESDRGFLIVSSTCVLSLTPIIWTATTANYLYGIMFFVLFGFAAILSTFVNSVRLVWIRVSTTIMLAVAFAAQIVFYFTETKQDWGIELYDVIWIISLMYLPAAMKGRAPYALTYWLVGIVMTSFPAFCVFYPVLLVLTVVTIYTHGSSLVEKSEKKEDEKQDESTPEQIALQQETMYRWILRGSSIAFWIAVLIHTYVDDRSKYFLPIAFAISLVIDLRLSTQSMKIGVIQLASNEAKILYDRKFPIDWKQSILWTVGLFIASTSVSSILTDTCHDCIVGLYTLFCIHAVLIFAVGFLSFQQDSTSASSTPSSSNSNAGTSGASKEASREAEQSDENWFFSLFPSHPLAWVYICSLVCFAVRFLITETDNHHRAHWPYYVGIGIAYVSSWKMFQGTRHVSIIGALGYLCVAMIINAVDDQEQVLKPFFIAVGMLLLHIASTWNKFSESQLTFGLVLFLGFIGIPARVVTDWQVSISLEVIIIIIQCSMLYPFAITLFSKMELPHTNQDSPQTNNNVAAIVELVILCGSLFFHRHSAVSLAVGAAVACILITFQCQRYHPIVQKIFMAAIPICVILNLIIHSSEYHLLFVGIELIVIGFFFVFPPVRIYIDEPSEEQCHQQPKIELPKHQEASSTQQDANSFDTKWIQLETFKFTYCQAVSTLTMIAGLGLIYGISFGYVTPILFTVLITVIFIASISRWMENIYYVAIFPIGVYMIAVVYEYDEYCFLFPAGACAILVALTSLPFTHLEIAKYCVLTAPKQARDVIREFMWQFCFLWIVIGGNYVYNILQLIAIGLALLRAFAFDHQIFYFIGLLHTIRMVHIDSSIYHDSMERIEFCGLCFFGWCLFTIVHPLRKKQQSQVGVSLLAINCALVAIVSIIAMFMTGQLAKGVISLILISVVTLLLFVLSPVMWAQLLWIYPLLIIYPVNTLMLYYTWYNFHYGRWGFLFGSIVALLLAVTSNVLWKIPKKTVESEISPASEENFKNAMWIMAVLLSLPAYYANLAIVCFLGFLGAIRKKWISIALVYPGFMALALTVVIWGANVDFNLAPAIAAGISCAVTSSILFLVPRKFWLITDEDKPIPFTIDFFFKSVGKPESSSTLSLVMEEQLVLWWLVSGMIVSYSDYERNEIWRGMIFPALALIFGTLQAVAGFLKSQHKWRVKIRTQGMLLMSIAVISGAAVSFSSDKSMIGGILLVVAGCMIIAVVILQLYWWNVFQKWMAPKGAQQTVKEAVADPFKKNPRPHNAEEETLASYILK